MIAVIPDLHGNLWALEEVLRERDCLGPAQGVVAGDLAHSAMGSMTGRRRRRRTVCWM